jgi:hypothetical protein
MKAVVAGSIHDTGTKNECCCAIICYTDRFDTEIFGQQQNTALNGQDFRQLKSILRQFELALHSCLICSRLKPAILDFVV